jgi:predicted O-methyltransferase YrrM
MSPSTFLTTNIPHPPPALEGIEADTASLGFTMASTPRTGAMLCTLAASKQGGRFLELGTGTGMAAAWLLHGMSADATLDTVDNDAGCVAVARRHLGHDPRLRFHLADGSEFLRTLRDERFDLIFADTWPGKFTDLDSALALLRPGGLYVIDDLLPQPNWPVGHAEKMPLLIQALSQRDDFLLWPLEWDTGIIVAARKA